MGRGMDARRTGSLVLVLAITMTAGGAIGRASEVPAMPKAEIPAAALSDADKIWTTRCSLCHGAVGNGDGPAAATINPKPRTLTDVAWQHTVDDAHIETIILKGGTAVNLSALMPANPDLDGKPDVVRALRAKVRSLAAK